MNKLFSKCQRRAFREIEDFIGGEDQEFLLKGGGGVGKTYLLDSIISKHRGYYFFCCAPTHKATGVLRGKIAYRSNNEFSTLQKFLGLVQDYDKEGNEIFETKTPEKYFVKQVEKFGASKEFVLIIDECSMIGDEMYEYLETVLSRSGEQLQILYVGDDYQLPPVAPEKKMIELSPVFTKVKRSFEMTTILRTDNDDLVLLYRVLRQCVDTHEDPKEFISQLQKRKNIHWLMKGEFHKQMRMSKENKNDMIVTHSNAKAYEYNNLIKNRSENEAQYQEGDKMMFNKFHEIGASRYNSGAIFKIAQCDEIKFESEYFDCVFDYHLITMDDGNEVMRVMKDDKIKFNKKVNDRKNKVKKKILSKRLCRDLIKEEWREFYRNKNFLNSPIADAYAITCYKSQGSTYENVYMDLTNIEFCLKKDIGMKNRCIYTAASRASKNIFIYCNLYKVESKCSKKKCSSCKNNKLLQDFFSKKKKGVIKKTCAGCRLKSKRQKKSIIEPSHNQLAVR